MIIDKTSDFSRRYKFKQLQYKHAIAIALAFTCILIIKLMKQ